MPKVSIVILNWNGKRFLKKCLTSLEKVRYSPLEIIVVDNNSSDGSQDFVRKNYPKVKLIENRKNYGYARGNNIGYKASTGDSLLILNNDIEVTPNFLKVLIEDFKKDKKIGCLQPKMVSSKDENELEGVGSFLTSTGFLYHYGYLKNPTNSKYNKKMKIYSAKGACMLLGRKAVETVGLFDEDFFIFFEETDFCHRLWLAGFKVVYEPKSVVYHFGAGDTGAQFKNERRVYLSFRNRICSYLKNLELGELLKILPVHLILVLAFAFYYLMRLKFKIFWAVVRGFCWNLLNLGETLKKRKKIQKIRRVSDKILFKELKVEPRPSYYYYLMTTLKDYVDKPI